MIHHILVPLDGSVLAECVLPHVLSIASAFDASVTLLHVLELSRQKGEEQAIDPLDWHLKQREAGVYLEGIAARLRGANLRVREEILEGLPADCVIDFANTNDVDLIALSTHGRSGLSGWNISSVVQKVILRAFKSMLLVRAYKPTTTAETERLHYRRLFIGLDCSARAEFILPVAVGLANFHKASIVLGTVIRKPEMLLRFPLSGDEQGLVTDIADMNYHAAFHYFEQLQSQLELQGVDLQTRLVVGDSVTASLHDMVDEEDADLVMLVAHGHSGQNRWPYGSVANSFILYGTTSLMIMQDLSGDEIKRTQAEMAAREIKGH